MVAMISLRLFIDISTDSTPTPRPPSQADPKPALTSALCTIVVYTDSELIPVIAA